MLLCELNKETNDHYINIAKTTSVIKPDNVHFNFIKLFYAV
jgi:hypothetical protein